MKTLWISHIVFLAAASTINGQALGSLSLREPSAGTSPVNTISFTLPASKLSILHNVRGEKLDLHVPNMLVNGDTLTTRNIHIRGTTSSYLRRKSLNIKLEKKAIFYSKRDTFALKKFYAISLNMDKN